MIQSVFKPIVLISIGYALWFSTEHAKADEKFTTEQIDFFESRIRPLLANHCLECHGPEKSESDLRLDSRTAILSGGASGDAGAIPGNSAESLIVKAVGHTGDYDMPPQEKLSEQQILDVAAWVEMGLPWPQSVDAIAKLTMPELLTQHRQTHWSFQPIAPPMIPEIGDELTSTVDKLITAKLKSKALTPSRRADRRTLIRRASFDLLGLPPTFEEVQSFINDDSPNAYAKLIDRLLDSPQYGERWARHWLDVARYADTSGYTLGNLDNSYPFAFTYRDYVIDAFNADLPYDQFIREQLAADYLDVPEDNKSLAALGFITVGRKYLGAPDTIDDQIDVVSRGLMGLTVSCARCHDHKYDAIPTEDYYSLYSVFANNYVPAELPLIGSKTDQAKFDAYFKTLEELKQNIETFRDSQLTEIKTHIHSHFVDYLAHVILPNQSELIEQQPFTKLKGAEVRKEVLQKWRQYFADLHEETTIIQPMLELISFPEEKFAESTSTLLRHWATHPTETEINSVLLQRLSDYPPQQKIDLAVVLGQLFEEIVTQWKNDGAKLPPLEQFNGPQRAIAAIVLSEHSPAMLGNDQLDQFLALPARKEIRKLRNAVGKHNTAAPDGIARAMILRDKEQLTDERVMIRGSVDRRGEIAPRRFVALFSDQERPEFKTRSGRLELAEKIASPDNPLTARVLVNRVWMHHFSQPIVETPSDFGIRCDEPIQRDLLDYLADDFIQNGWSLKHLHRTIMLSDAYCQSSDSRPEYRSVDPENRLIWKMNRRRLEFEPLRDSVLAVTKQLDLKLHGKPVDLIKDQASQRRTIYGFIDRQDLPGLYRVFDLASPDQSAEKRTRTSVPQQSLFMLNSVFMNRQSCHLINTLGESLQSARDQKVTLLYRIVYQRDPDALELEIANEFLETAEPRKDELSLGPWQRYAQMLLCANEFEFID